MDGWIKLYRKLIDSAVFKNEGLLKVWIWCLLKACHKKTWVSFKTGKSSTEIELLPGQFIFGRKRAAKELNMSTSTVRNRIKKLGHLQNLKIKPKGRQYSVITLVNWHFYQDSQKEFNYRDNKKDNNNNPESVENSNFEKIEEKNRTMIKVNKRTLREGHRRINKKDNNSNLERVANLSLREIEGKKGTSISTIKRSFKGHAKDINNNVDNENNINTFASNKLSADDGKGNSVIFSKNDISAIKWADEQLKEEIITLKKHEWFIKKLSEGITEEEFNNFIFKIKTRV